MRKLGLIVCLLCLAGCGKYTMEEAKENGDIIVQNDVTNSDRFESFLKKSTQGKSDQIRITAFTTEGDPVLYDVKYDGKSYQYTSDSSRDQFGTTDDDRKNEVCKRLVKTTEKEQSVYTLRQCAKGADHELLRLPKQ
ncbi:hypothetical protein ADM98_10780 [Exiguobacterium sp. BMC-KP]|uniref:DUF4362 domain-containing protein n=1 Tax=Exiguobacterium sp. BMC-KP TaxID=1684312 RepID=UPI0006AA1CC8|nr:DUF4362 domain-containing protein [Exiguobacterium sp. BMC-KP]KOP29358.1 hypothetical protein ADM98_10780 [Exiguobacterium sp. BMC-KP]